MFNNRVLWGWDATSSSGGTDAIIRRVFIKNTSGEAITICSKIITSVTQYQLAKLIRAKFSEIFLDISGESEDKFNFVGVYEGANILASVIKRTSYRVEDEDYGPPTSTTNEYIGDKLFISSVNLTGPHDQIVNLMRSIKSSITEHKTSVLRWWYKERNSWTVREIFLEKPKTKLHKLLYPSIKKEPAEYIKEYLQSDQSILLISGDPGMGKTSFLRHMIYDFELDADITYDEEALKSDTVFQSWMFDSKSSMMIIEDADKILSARSTDNNPMMARFLNVSEGLVKLPNKKLIFTTNLNDYNKVDAALVRPGRCFGMLKMMPFEYKQAVEVCEYMEWPIPSKVKEYTIAELSHQTINPELHKIGY